MSPSWGSALDQRFGLGSKINVISNGYDPEHLSRIEPHEFGHFAIVYAGTFYPPKRVISPVMAALGHLKARAPENPNWVFHYYGPHQGHIREEAARFGVSDRVVVHGNTSRAAALSAVRGAGLAVVISSVDENAQSGDEGIVPAKLFESIGLECPTLVIAPANSDIGAICERTGLALRFDGSQIEGIAAFIADAMRRKTPARREPEMYAWTNIVKKLDAVLRTVIDGNSSRSTSRADTSSGPVEVFTSTAPGSR